MKKGIYYTIIILLFSIFIISLINIFMWQNDNKHTRKMIREIKKSVIKKSEKTSDNDSISEIDFNKLKNINSDIIGYIKVNGTNIDYPVVQTVDNDFYLTHSFDKSYNKAGWVFMDYRNKWLDDNTIIYAHGRLDKTMFGSLRNVIKKNWYKDSKNYNINYISDKYNTRWQVFSVYKIKTTDDYLRINLDENEKDSFINLIKKRSVYNFNVGVTSFDKILTLSSCYDNTYKVVLHAKLIEIRKNSYN